MAKYVQIEITTRCNFSCFYCAGRRMPQRSMDWQVFEGICARYQGQGVMHNLQGEGEPILHRKLWDMAALVRNLGNKPFVITNLGYRLTPRLARQITSSFDEIGVSLDSVDEAVSTSIGRTKLGQVMDNLKHLLDARGSDFITVFTVDLGKTHVERVRRALETLGVARHIVQPLQGKWDYACGYPSDVVVQPRVYPNGRKQCRYLRDDVMDYYDVDGKQFPCCYIKDTRHFASAKAIEAQLQRGEVPPTCVGCREIISHSP